MQAVIDTILATVLLEYRVKKNAQKFPKVTEGAPLTSQEKKKNPLKVGDTIMVLDNIVVKDAKGELVLRVRFEKGWVSPRTLFRSGPRVWNKFIGEWKSLLKLELVEKQLDAFGELSSLRYLNLEDADSMLAAMDESTPTGEKRQCQAALKKLIKVANVFNGEPRQELLFLTSHEQLTLYVRCVFAFVCLLYSSLLFV